MVLMDVFGDLDVVVEEVVVSCQEVACECFFKDKGVFEKTV